MFFAALSKVRRTRGTGGVITGNDEANRESDHAGGGANYITDGFGPLGQATQARHRGLTLAAYRAEVLRMQALALQNGWR